MFLQLAAVFDHRVCWFRPSVVGPGARPERSEMRDGSSKGRPGNPTIGRTTSQESHGGQGGVDVTAPLTSTDSTTNLHCWSVLLQDVPDTTHVTGIFNNNWGWLILGDLGRSRSIFQCSRVRGG